MRWSVDYRYAILLPNTRPSRPLTDKQNWSLVCCIIEVVVEVLTILVYGIVFYRYYSKRKLRKSMARRDTARSDLYLAQLRSQSAPNTPGFGPMSPRSGGWIPPPGHPAGPGTPYKGTFAAAAHAKEVDSSSDDEEGVQYASVPPTRTFSSPKPFALQPPPIKIHAATPRMNADGFSPIAAHMAPSPPHSPPPMQETLNEHAPVAQGETQYASVMIPGSYAGASPLNSPGFASTHHHAPQSAGMGGFDFGLDGALRR